MTANRFTAWAIISVPPVVLLLRAPGVHLPVAGLASCQRLSILGNSRSRIRRTMRRIRRGR
jgi:hypothetical protein